MNFRWSNGVLAPELCAGSAPVTKALRKLGYAAIAFDIGRGPQFDLLNKTVASLVQGWISSGCIAGLWLSLHSTTYALSGLVPLRSLRHLSGVARLTSVQQAKVHHADALTMACLPLLRLAARLGVPAGMEHPTDSALWHFPSACSLGRQGVFLDTDLCGFGTPWRKTLRLLLFNVRDVAPLGFRCTAHHGRCSFSFQRHTPLASLGATSGHCYPARLAYAVAECLATSAQFRNMDLRQALVHCSSFG